jgi:hypothetical protein
MNYWIISSKHSRDESAKDWSSKWTADNIIRQKKFFPSLRKYDFKNGDICIIKVFGSQDFIGTFKINSDRQIDNEKDIYYEISEVDEWDFPINQHLLPIRYTNYLSRSTSTNIPEYIYYEIIGIKNFTQNLKINYKHRLNIRISEKDVEILLDVKNALKDIGLEIIERQKEITPGNIIDIIGKDSKGDLAVIELKKHSPNETIGQLARYVTDVREHFAKS